MDLYGSSDSELARTTTTNKPVKSTRTCIPHSARVVATPRVGKKVQQPKILRGKGKPNKIARSRMNPHRARRAQVMEDPSDSARGEDSEDNDMDELSPDKRFP
jgi:hypothetical protein